MTIIDGLKSFGIGAACLVVGAVAILALGLIWYAAIRKVQESIKETWWTCAWILHKRGDTEKAKRALHLAVAGDDRRSGASAAYANIDHIRTLEGHSVTILCDNPEAESIDVQAAVEVVGDFTGWQPQRFYARTWTEALSKAADASRAFNAREKATP